MKRPTNLETNLGPQFHQLTMFHTARELRGGGVGKFLPADLMEVEDYSDQDEFSDPDGDDMYTMRQETEDEGWERKADEAEWTGLAESVAQHGVSRPVDLHVGGGGRETGTIMNGHHRVAIQHDLNPDALVPVNWTNRDWGGTAPGSGTPKWRNEDEERLGYEKDY